MFRTPSSAAEATAEGRALIPPALKTPMNANCDPPVNMSRLRTQVCHTSSPEATASAPKTQAPYGSSWWLDRSGAREQTERIREQFDVRTPNIDVSAHALSGGNQQKLIIGRELTSDPDVLVAAHPTRGIDVGAQAAVWDDIRAARRNGLATLLISADLDELIGLSDTIVVMLRGEFVATLSPDEVTPRDLGAYMTGAALQNGGAA